MTTFYYRNNELFCEEVKVHDIATKIGTPFYLYSRKSFENNFEDTRSAFAALDPLICYSVKTCGNIHILKLLAKVGAGMDVVSGGELYRALQAGVHPTKIVFAGTGKTDEEIAYAIDSNIGCINIESEQELLKIESIAAEEKKYVQLAVRINPDVYDERTHEKTKTGHKGSKFGVDIEKAYDLFVNARRLSKCHITGLHFHLGSPIYSPEIYSRAIEKTLQLTEKLKAINIHIDTINIGGGYAVNYTSNLAPDAKDYAATIVPLLKKFVQDGGRVIMEPGRSISASSGVLISKVLYLKEGGGNEFAVLDAGMSQLLRPSLYDAFHFIWPVKVSEQHLPNKFLHEMDFPNLKSYDIVGPICESSDYLARKRLLPPLERNELICIFNSGAYGMVMASNYNAVPRAPEVLVDSTIVNIIRERETNEELVRAEKYLRTISIDD